MSKTYRFAHKPFGITHPTWKQPTNFYYDTAEEAAEAILRVYGEHSEHLVVGVIVTEEQA